MDYIIILFTSYDNLEDKESFEIAGSMRALKLFRIDLLRRALTWNEIRVSQLVEKLWRVPIWNELLYLGFPI